MTRVPTPEQVRVIQSVCHFYHPRAFALDRTGIGLPLFQDLQAADPETAAITKGFNFSEKVLVEIDKTKEVDPLTGDIVKEAGIHRLVLEESTDQLRRLVDEDRILLPWDRELLGEFQGQSYTVVRDHMNPYGKRQFSGGSAHCLDAARMAAMAYTQAPMEAMIEGLQHREPVYDRFVTDVVEDVPWGAGPWGGPGEGIAIL
jgi:hypothetical protein